MRGLDFLVVSDLHLEGYEALFPDHDDANEYVFVVLRQVMAYARQQGVKHIIIPGDIFDRPNPSDKSVMALLRFLMEFHIFEFWFIPGNHDFENNREHSLEMLKFLNDELSLMPHVHYFVEPTLRTIEGVEFSFLPWPHRQPLSENPHVVVAHIDVAGAKRPSGRMVKPSSATELAEGEHLWLIGHIHNPQIIGKNKNIVYVGSVLQKNFGEIGVRYFWHGRCIVNEGRMQRQIKPVAIVLPYELTNLTFNSIDDLHRANIKPSDRQKIRLYNVFCAKGLVLPPNFMAEHPNIVNVQPVGTGKHGAIEIGEQDLMTPEWMDLDVRTTVMSDLDDFMVKREVSPEIVETARSILTGIMAQHVKS